MSKGRSSFNVYLAHAKIAKAFGLSARLRSGCGRVKKERNKERQLKIKRSLDNRAAIAKQSLLDTRKSELI